MIRAALGLLLMLACSGLTTAQATDLNLYLATDSGIEDKIVVCPGASLIYTVTGDLSDTASEGLAGFSFDLTFDGGDLTQASPMPSIIGCFVERGFTNPAGFGGRTDVPGREGDLVQVGGAQNTINNTEDNVPSPTGLIDLNVCQTPRILAGGVLVAPDTPGSYTLSIPGGSVRANVITASTTGVPFWAVEPAALGANSILSLTVEVIEVIDECSPTVAALEVFYSGRFGSCVGGDRDGLDCSSDDDCIGTLPTPDGFCSGPWKADPSVQFLGVGSTATTDNISNYIRGITGIRVYFNLVVEFATTPEAALAFEWSMPSTCVGGTDDGISCNPTPPNPNTDPCLVGGGTCEVLFYPVTDTATAITVTPTVEDGVTVVRIVLADDHVRRRWLKVTIDSTQVTTTGVELDGELVGNPVVLPSGDTVPGGDAVFYLGNQTGDVDFDRRVLLTDVGLIRVAVNPFSFVLITNVYDVDKDVKVLLTDVGLARLDVNPFFRLPLITP